MRRDRGESFRYQSGWALLRAASWGVLGMRIWVCKMQMSMLHGSNGGSTMSIEVSK